MFEAVLNQLRPFAREFSRRGKEVYLVGGAVRNLLLGRPVKDFDFTTDALPTEVQGFFPRVLPTGLQHGTVTVLFQGGSYEVTTFRVDGDYTDGRRPDGVTFTPSLEEDLARRDFTINALAVNLTTGQLVDYHGGQRDLEARLLRAIGDPGTRFDEDALRLLRLFRFSSQLGFAIDGPTLDAVGPRRHKLAAVSRERIREELAKALAGDRPDLAWGPLGALGFLTDLFAPLEPRLLDSQTLAALGELPPDLRWAAWLTLACAHRHSEWESVLKGLTFSNADQQAALGPAKALAFLDSTQPLSLVAKAILEAWGSRARALPGIEYLDFLEQRGFWTDWGLKAELARVAASDEPVFLKELPLKGNDVVAEGFPPGPRVGEVLGVLQRMVWENPGLGAEELRSRLRDLR